MSHDIFISYSSKDKVIADAVCAKLENNKIRCWIAPRDILPGMEYGQALVDAIKKSRAIVLVLSSNSNVSPQVMREIERAVSNEIPIIPLRIENIQPSESMEYYLSSVHWLDAITPPIEQHLDKLTDTVIRILGRKILPGEDAAAQPEAETAAQEHVRREGQEREQPAAEQRLPEITRLQREIETALAGREWGKAKQLIPQLNNLGPDGQALADRLQKRLPKTKIPGWAWVVGGLVVVGIIIGAVFLGGGNHATQKLSGVTPTLLVQATEEPALQPVHSDTPTLTLIPTTPAPTSTLTPIPTVTPLHPVVLRINANVRSGPGTVYPILVVFTAGTQVQILGRNHAGDWVAIALPDNKQGWIALSSLQVGLDVGTLAELKAPPAPTLEHSPTEASNPVAPGPTTAPVQPTLAPP